MGCRLTCKVHPAAGGDWTRVSVAGQPCARASPHGRLGPRSLRLGIVSVIRLFSFHTGDRAFDGVLRNVMIPDLLAKPGIVDCYVGRQETGELGPRIVAPVWESRQAMVAAVGDRLGVFHPEYLDATTDQSLEILNLRIAWRSGLLPDRILRVLRGAVRPGEIDAYVDDVEHGLQRDAADAHGPNALYLAESGVDAFVTVSAWREWSDIEHATGGNVDQPRLTRQPERLIGWEVEHFELV
jgi:hypothetical protein